MVVSIILPQNSSHKQYLCLLPSTSATQSYRPRAMLRSSPHRLLNQASSISSQTNSIFRSLNRFSSKKAFPHAFESTGSPSQTPFAITASHSQSPHSFPATASSPSDSEPQPGEPFPHLQSRVNTHVETQDIWFDPLLASVTPFSEPKFEPIQPSKRKPKQPTASVSASAVIPAETFAVNERRRNREVKRSETAVKLAARDVRIQVTANLGSWGQVHVHVRHRTPVQVQVEVHVLSPKCWEREKHDVTAVNLLTAVSFSG